MKWDDDKLSAFLDGELPPEEMTALERSLAADTALAARLQQLAGASRAFADSIASIDARPLPASVGSLLTADGARVIPFRRRSLPLFVMEHRAVAASIVCAAAVWSVAMLTRVPELPASNPLIAANSPLGRALDGAQTGERTEIGRGVSVEPQLTFASAADSFCRQYRLASDSAVAEAIACREDETWQVKVTSFAVAARAGPDYQTARSPRSPALEAFIDANIAGDPLDREAEAELIARDWNRAR
jgi:hypothetical protein